MWPLNSPKFVIDIPGTFDEKQPTIDFVDRPAQTKEFEIRCLFTKPRQSITPIEKRTGHIGLLKLPRARRGEGVGGSGGNSRKYDICKLTEKHRFPPDKDLWLVANYFAL